VSTRKILEKRSTSSAPAGQGIAGETAKGELETPSLDRLVFANTPQSFEPPQIQNTMTTDRPLAMVNLENVKWLMEPFAKDGDIPTKGENEGYSLLPGGVLFVHLSPRARFYAKDTMNVCFFAKFAFEKNQ
jgi:hypothetical protein